MARPRSRPRGDVLLPQPAPDGEIYVTGRQAADIVGVSPRTIRLWHEFGWLPEAGQEDGGRRLLMYRYGDLLEADLRARDPAACSRAS